MSEATSRLRQRSAVTPVLTLREQLSRRLRELRRDAHLTGEALAARTKMSQSKISKIETGRQLASVDDIERIARAIGAPDSLMTAQLDRLIVLATLTNVDIAVLPLSTELDVLPQTSFTLYDDVLVEIELGSGQVAISDPADVAGYAKDYQALVECSATGQQALDIIARLRAAQIDGHQELRL